LLALPGPVGAQQGGKTTLDRTIVAEGERELTFGPGQARVTRSIGWKQKSGKGKPLAGFKQISDVHVVDEESPARLEYLDECDPRFSSAYRPHEAMTTQVGDSMVRTLNSITKGPGTGVPLSFTISTGDNIDNNQLNELRWFIDLLDGKQVNPNSGAATYDGYTQAHSSQALDDSILELAQAPFQAAGIKGPWYAVLGNHDGLVQGEVPQTAEFQLVTQQGKKVFANQQDFPNGPEDPNDFDEIIGIFRNAYLTQTEEVPADSNRRFVNKDDAIAEYMTTTGKPNGHGFNAAPVDPVDDRGRKAGYYAFSMGKKVQGISLDTVDYSGMSRGSVSDPQFKWLEQQLKKNSKKFYTRAGKVRKNPKATNKLFVLFSHHSSKSLDNPGTDADYGPFHCFTPTEDCSGQPFRKLLNRYPNVVAWVNGHEHNNAIRAYKGPKGTNADRAFWEINTAAHVDWPSQSRLIEIAYRPGLKKDSVFIYTTTVDHGAALVPNQTQQSATDYLASISRIEAYYDACVRQQQADCSAAGRPADQNTKLVLKAPFDLGN
jgi:metallophosphoesterase (TIGR03767 family)